MTLADELFSFLDVRQRTPEERLYRLVDSVLDDTDCELLRVTWDAHDCSVEVYLENVEVPQGVGVTRLWEAGFKIVWIHPGRCTTNGRRDHSVCHCPARRRVRP